MALVSIFRSGKGKWINFHQQGETSIQRSWNSSAGCQKSSELYLTLYCVESILGLGQQIETKLEGVDSNFWWVKTEKLSLKNYFSLFRWTACTNIHQFYFLIKDNPSKSPTLARELSHEFAAQFLFVSWVFRFFLCFCVSVGWVPRIATNYVFQFMSSPIVILFLQQFAAEKVVPDELKYAH